MNVQKVPVRKTHAEPGTTFGASKAWQVCVADEDKGVAGGGHYGSKYVVTPPLELETKRSRRNLRSGLVALVVVIVVAAIGILVTVAHHAPPSSKAQPHLLGRLSKEPTGQISGVFERVGGPALPAKNGGTTTLRVPLNGMVEVHEGSRRGRIVAQARTVHGRFTVTVPAGRYVLNGSSPDGFNCPTFKARQVAEGQTVQLNVICPVP